METAKEAVGAERPAGVKEEGQTLIGTIYATLRREIVDGSLKPGAKLRTQELRARYNTSGSTIREALTRLLGEALVTTESQRGFSVAPASIDDFRDLTEIRKLIETEALRQSIVAGDENWETQVVAAFYRLSKVEERLAENPFGAMGEFEGRNREFHEALITEHARQRKRYRTIFTKPSGYSVKLKRRVDASFAKAKRQ